mmetsp:Transcript_10908/g.21734  ORF Transcript_10908/g.21734 Transcript_10908/m.21734 type:complete len:209 (-) Transcript_10908:339-965(-)
MGLLRGRGCLKSRLRMSSLGWECGLVGRPNLAHWMSLWDHMWMGMDTVCTLRRLFMIEKKIQYGNEVKAGDVIGCLLHLSTRGRAFEPAPSDFVRYKGRIHTRMRIDGGCLPTRTNIEGSFMEVYINGMSQGRVFCDAILEGTYYPTVSLFTRSTDPSKMVKARVNFGSNRGGENGQGWWADYVEHCFQTCVKSVAMLACDDADEDSI